MCEEGPKPINWPTRARIWIWKMRYAIWMQFRTKMPFSSARMLSGEGWAITLEWEGSVEKALAVHPLQAVNDELECWTPD